MEHQQPSTLAALLARQMRERGWSLRDAEREIGISKTAVRNILEKPNVVPELETLSKIASALDLPLWRVIEVAGFDLDLSRAPLEKAQLLASLVATVPELDSQLHRLDQWSREDLQGLLAYIEVVEKRRGRA